MNKKDELTRKMIRMVHDHAIFHDQNKKVDESRDKDYITKLWHKFYGLENEFYNEVRKEKAGINKLLKKNLQFFSFGFGCGVIIMKFFA